MTPKNGVTEFDEDAAKLLNVNKSISSKVTFKYENVSTVAVIRGSYMSNTMKKYVLKMNDNEGARNITLNFTNINDTQSFDVTSVIQTITNDTITSEAYTTFSLINSNTNDESSVNFVSTKKEVENVTGKYVYTISIADKLKETIRNYDFDNNENKYTLNELWTVTQINNPENKATITLNIEIEKI